MHEGGGAADAIAIAHAFQNAMDEDTMNALNTQSKKSDIDQLHYYVVPAQWMRMAWPVLQGQEAAVQVPSEWRELVGRIEACSLVSWKDQSVISDEEEEDSHRPPPHVEQKSAVLHELHKMHKTEGSPKPNGKFGFQRQRIATLDRGRKHVEDFFLLGSDTWTLVSNKFGFDDELRLNCVWEQQEDSTLSVVLHEANGTEPRVTLPIPASGRFGYQEILKNQALALGNGAAAAASLQPGNVSDDETTAEGPGDLFPSPDDDERMSTEQQQSSSEPVLLLPPSTTASNGGMMELETTDVVATSNARRKFGSGLGNLGNTCFMNSSLQCLAHTDPLREYFLSGDYEKDLNRDNPLGTGGDLAIHFASLLRDMWGASASKTFQSAYSSGSYGSNHVVYPRNFKYTLGKHAEQFVGYDQHDSQELATYLLDALHEDTNRVSKKPYVEKPEQGEDESDEVAAEKAWQLNLKRENSRVLEMFMGQVKSRVQCCEPKCGRVSTTFDPFMYLSVPIPGSSERTLRVTFVPLDPTERAMQFSVTLSKLSSVGDLVKKVKEQLGKVADSYESLALEDIAAVDMWNKEVYAWYEPKTEIDRIRDTDETFMYQLKPLREIQEIEKKIATTFEAENEADLLGGVQTSRVKRFKLDIATSTRINRTDWRDEMTKHLKSPTGFLFAFNKSKDSTVERVKMYEKLVNFIDECQGEIEVDVAGQKRARDENGDVVLPDTEPLPGLKEQCEKSPTFCGVNSRHDLGILEFLAGKMRAEILKLEREKNEEFPNGLLVEVRMVKTRGYVATSSDSNNLVPPVILRVPSTTTVYGLRTILASRLSRSLKTGRHGVVDTPSGQSTSESDMSVSEMQNGDGPPVVPMDSPFGSPELLTLRQIPLTYERKTATSYRTYSTGKKLGSLEKLNGKGYDVSRKTPLASPDDEDEQSLVAESVGNLGKVFLEWPAELCEQAFDVKEYEQTSDPLADDSNGPRTRSAANAVSISDCIEKYCQMEQLEESEMWYCNRCKKHVRAWKQFHLYRSPPILIIHLKRFQYSAASHRRDKIGVFIDFPLEDLDLSQHFMHSDDEEKPIYDCYAVSNHYGGLGGGHYTAHALNDDGSWCYYDDSRITTNADPKDVVSQAAYVLYYRRKDVQVGREYPINVHTPGVPAPTLIQVEKNNDASEVSSNAAMVGEDDTMDIDDKYGDDKYSRTTSPMGSIEDGQTLLEYDTETGGGMENERDSFPLQ